MPLDAIRMAGELTTQFAVGPPFKEGPLGFDGVGGVAIAVLDFPALWLTLLMRQGCLGEPMLLSDSLTAEDVAGHVSY